MSPNEMLDAMHAIRHDRQGEGDPDHDGRDAQRAGEVTKRRKRQKRQMPSWNSYRFKSRPNSDRREAHKHGVKAESKQERDREWQELLDKAENREWLAANDRSSKEKRPTSGTR